MEKSPCPKCREEGRDRNGDNLWTYEDGKSYCHAGHGVIRKSERTEVRMESKLSVSDCLTNTVGHDPDRGISREVIEKYDVRIEFDGMSGKPKRVYYPYKDDTGRCTGVKIRIYPKDFLVAGKLGGVFGKQLAPTNPKTALFITEGEEDALALSEIFRPTAANANIVVSIPNGASTSGKLDEVILNEQTFFKKFRKVYIVLDSDIPGKATAKRLAEYLISVGLDVYIVDLHEHKDASEYLVKGDGALLLKRIRETSKYTPEGIVHGSSISVTDLITAMPEGYNLPYIGLNDKLRGVRKGEILTVCAGSGIGKSTLVREIGYDLVVRHGLSVCHIALEDRIETTAASYVAMDNDVPTAVFRSNPSSIPTGSIEASMDRTVRRMYFFNHFGSINSGEFRSKLMYYARSGVDFIVLDHLSMVISGSDISNERKEIDKIMTDLASMVVETGVGLINVVHLKRREHRDSGKSLNEGGSVSLTDLRGSAALEQLSWSVIAMERDQQAEDGSEDYAYLRVLKNRTWGFTGKAGRVKYIHKTGRLIDFPEEPDNEEAHDIDKELPAEKEPGIETYEDLLKILGLSGQEEGIQDQP